MSKKVFLPSDNPNILIPSSNGDFPTVSCSTNPFIFINGETQRYQMFDLEEYHRQIAVLDVPKSA